ncbi:MAG TPA: CopD family protein [Steroidobacteraceae bacterium]|nr:CopD family protein [Steroidobacteraceae bacterium]
MLEALTALLKIALYAGLLSSSGAVFAQATLRPLPDEWTQLARLGRLGSVLILVTCPLLVVLLILRLSGEFDEATLSAVFLSNTGAALCLQMTGAALLLISSSEDDSSVVRLSYAMLPMLSFAFSGHAAGVSPVDGSVAVVHVSLAGWWLGSLFFLRRACVNSQIDRVVTVVTRFSTMALILTGVLVIAGLVLVMILIDFSKDPWLSPYGWILATKLSVVAILLAVAGYNRRRLTPRLLARDSSAMGALRTTINVELLLIGLILTITAILTTYSSPPD